LMRYTNKIIFLFLILIGLHAFLILKLLPVINNANYITTMIKNDYNGLYLDIKNVLINTNQTISDFEDIIKQLNQTINNINSIYLF